MPVIQDDGHPTSTPLTAFNLSQHANILLQLITTAQLVHFVLIRRRPPSLPLALCTLLVLVTYIAELRPVEGDLHFLTFTSRTPHPVAQRSVHGHWYNAALVSIFASAFLQVQCLSKSRQPASGMRILTGAQNKLSWTSEWVTVFVGLAGAVALAAMRSPVLEAFLGGDFDKTRRLSGANVLIAFLLLLWRGVTFLDIFSTIYSLNEARERDKIVLALWQRASLPMAAELTFDICSILIYESFTLKTFSRDEVGQQTAGIQVFDSPMAIALTALAVALAKSLAERNAQTSASSSSSSSSSISDHELALTKD